jgi:hypothetical protein
MLAPPGHASASVADAAGGARRVREVQAAFAPYKQPGVSVVDELIRERREEAARENREAEDWMRQHGRDRE